MIIVNKIKAKIIVINVFIPLCVEAELTKIEAESRHESCGLHLDGLRRVVCSYFKYYRQDEPTADCTSIKLNQSSNFDRLKAVQPN